MEDIVTRNFKDETPKFNYSDLADRIQACLFELIEVKTGPRPSKELIFDCSIKHGVSFDFIRKVGGWEPEFMNLKEVR